MNAKEREKQITRTSIVGIIANIFLSVFKVIVGLLSGAISIILDAVNNITDALSSVITIVGVKLAKMNPNKKHPFGYGRIEYFSALIISGIIIAAGVSSVVESIKKIINPETPEYSAVTLVIVAVAIVVKFFLGRYVKAQGKKFNSDALVASGEEAGFDAIISLATLVSAIITLVFHINLDGFFGAAISCVIVKAGIEMLLESVSSVLGNRPDSIITKDIKATVKGIPGVNGAYDLVLHNYGPNSAMGSIHVEVDESFSATDIHKLTKLIQKTIIEKFHVFLTVGIYAVDKAHEAERKAIIAKTMEHQGVMGSHAVFFDDENKYVSFDVGIDFTVPDRQALREEIIKEVNELLPGYTVDINWDLYYSD